jgi:hypothetical protein
MNSLSAAHEPTSALGLRVGMTVCTSISVAVGVLGIWAMIPLRQLLLVAALCAFLVRANRPRA